MESHDVLSTTGPHPHCRVRPPPTGKTNSFLRTQAAAGTASLLPDLRVSTFVMACRITVPAFSISFLDSPVVTQTLSAGCSFHPTSFPVLLTATGMLFSRVIKTPLAADCGDGWLAVSTHCKSKYTVMREENVAR